MSTVVGGGGGGGGGEERKEERKKERKEKKGKKDRKKKRKIDMSKISVTQDYSASLTQSTLTHQYLKLKKTPLKRPFAMLLKYRPTPISVGNMFQVLLRLHETADNTICYI
jgi:hypothetical protein